MYDVRRGSNGNFVWVSDNPDQDSHDIEIDALKYKIAKLEKRIEEYQGVIELYLIQEFKHIRNELKLLKLNTIQTI